MHAVWCMYYSGEDVNLDHSAIGLATSPDFINWTKYSGNPLITAYDPAFDYLQERVKLQYVRGSTKSRDIKQRPNDQYVYVRCERWRELERRLSAGRSYRVRHSTSDWKKPSVVAKLVVSYLILNSQNSRSFYEMILYGRIMLGAIHKS